MITANKKIITHKEVNVIDDEMMRQVIEDAAQKDREAEFANKQNEYVKRLNAMFHITKSWYNFDEVKRIYRLINFIDADSNSLEYKFLTTYNTVDTFSLPDREIDLLCQATLKFLKSPYLTYDTQTNRFGWSRDAERESEPTHITEITKPSGFMDRLKAWLFTSAKQIDSQNKQ